MTVTCDLHDDRTFRRVTTVTGTSNGAVARSREDHRAVLSRTVVTGRWAIAVGGDAGRRGAVRLHVTACDGDACGSDVDIEATLDLPYAADSDGGIILEIVPGTTATRDPVPSNPHDGVVPLSAAAGSGQVTLTWDLAGVGIERWEYRQSTDGGVTWTDWMEVAGSGADTTTHTVTGLQNGTVYTFQVRARDARANGPSSDTATATPTALPAAPPPDPAGNMCRRTPLVRDRIVQAVPEKDDCADVTAADLATIAQLRLCTQSP